MKYEGKDSSKALKGKRKVYLFDRRDFALLKVYDGTILRYGNLVEGPAIIEQPHTTVFVPTPFQVHCDQVGSYIMVLKNRAKELLREGR
jgi:N-methylhydantoinase A